MRVTFDRGVIPSIVLHANDVHTHDNRKLFVKFDICELVLLHQRHWFSLQIKILFGSDEHTASDERPLYEDSSLCSSLYVFWCGVFVISINIPAGLVGLL